MTPLQPQSHRVVVELQTPVVFRRLIACLQRALTMVCNLYVPCRRRFFGVEKEFAPSLFLANRVYPLGGGVAGGLKLTSSLDGGDPGVHYLTSIHDRSANMPPVRTSGQPGMVGPSWVDKS